MRHWTKEERERQAELIQRWQPWKRSTGPKTKQGKEVAAMNALKHGERTAQAAQQRKQINELFRSMKDQLEEIVEV